MSLPRFQAGKKYLLDGGTLNEIDERLATLRLLPGTGYDLDIRPGQGTRLLNLRAAAEVQMPWQLVQAGEEYRISRPGRVFLSYADLDSAVEIVDVAESFALEAEHAVYLKLTTPAAPVLTLVAGPKWTEWPVTYKMAEPPDPSAVVEAYFLLWECIEGTLPEEEFGVQFSEFYARRTHRSGDSVLIWGAHDRGDGFSHVSVPVLVPL